MQIRAAGFPARSSGTAYRVMHFFKHGWANLSSYSTAVLNLVHTRVPPGVHMEESDAPYRCYAQLNLALEYCQIEQNRTADVVAASARRDHRKSKFGLRQGIKLN